MSHAHEAIRIPGPISVRELAELLDESPIAVIKTLMAMGVMANINQVLDPDTAALAAEEMGHPVLLPGEEEAQETEEAAEEEAADIEEEVEPVAEVKPTRKQRLYANERPEDLKPRPPIVAVLGHVDHGKTTLLDAIRQTRVAEGEAGGITQHIGAYQVKKQGRLITFIDTPGHEAFTAMRARGAQGADIVILVIAADDGVMPQTIEAYEHAKAAGVPIIVAVTKVDKPNANPDRVRQQAADKLGLIPEEWGGDVPFVNVAAPKGQGIDELLDYILIVTDLHQDDIVANPNRSAQGVVLESELDPRQGVVATLLVLNGTLRQRDTVLAGTAYGRIRAMFNDQGKRVKEAPPSTPVRVLGLNEVPPAGQFFEVVESERAAREIVEQRKRRLEQKRSRGRITLEDVFRQLQAGQREELNLVVKADTQGTLDALVDSLHDLATEDVAVKIIRQGVGAVSESDVMLASASDAIVIGFGVKVDRVARERAEQEGVQIRTYDVIYHLLEDMEKALKGLLEPETEEFVLGTAEVRAVFKVRGGKVAGCYVLDGVIRRNAKARLIRDGEVIADTKVASLKRFQEDVAEVRQGFECGIALEGVTEYKEGDLIEAYEVREV